MAPIWLQNVLSLWLQVVGKFKIITCTTTFEALPFLLVPSPDALKGTSLVIADELTVAQVQKLKQIWPTTYLLLLADAAQAELLLAGADDVLPKTFCPDLLLKAIDEWEASWATRHRRLSIFGAGDDAKFVAPRRFDTILSRFEADSGGDFCYTGIIPFSS